MPFKKTFTDANARRAKAAETRSKDARSRLFDAIESGNLSAQKEARRDLESYRQEIEDLGW